MQQGPRAANVEPYPEGKLRLRPGEELTAGATLTSVDRKSKVVIDGGALIVYTHDSKGAETTAFHTHTTAGVALRYAADGGLTLVDGDGATLWSAPTASKGLGGPGTVAVDDAGALCVTDSTGANVWTSAGGAWAQAKANAAALADVASQAAAAALDAGKAAAAAAVGAGKAAVVRVTTAPGVGDAVAQAKEGV